MSNYGNNMVILMGSPEVILQPPKSMVLLWVSSSKVATNHTRRNLTKEECAANRARREGEDEEGESFALTAAWKRSMGW